MPDKLDCFFDKLSKLVDKGIKWMENILIIIKQVDSNSQIHIPKDLAWKFNSNYVSCKYCHKDWKLNEEWPYRKDNEKS